MKLAGKFGCKYLRGSSEMGPFWLSRPNTGEAKVLDNTDCLIRINKNECVWYMVPKNYQPVSKLKDAFKDKTVMIVGKGPSLDLLRDEDCDGVDVIIACNDAVHHVVGVVGHLDVPIYNVQCDPLAGNCYAPGATPVIIAKCAHFYVNADPMYLINADDLGPKWHPVGCTAIHVAKMMGCSDVLFVGFDGAFVGKMGYADVIDKSPTEGRYTDPGRFRSHQKPMLDVLDGLPFEVFRTTNSDRGTVVCDTPEQSQENQQAPSEHDHGESPTLTPDN